MSAWDTDGEDTERQTTYTAPVMQPEICSEERDHTGNEKTPPDKTSAGSEEHRVNDSIDEAAKHYTKAGETPLSNLTTISGEVRDNESLAGAEEEYTKAEERTLRGSASEEHRFNASLKQAEEHYVYFWQQHDAFSQWHKSPFVLDNKKFCCAEQYMMYMKAVLLHDDKLAKRILSCEDPRRIKSLGRQTEQFSEDLWVHNCLHVVKEGNLAKFRQNKHLNKKLFNTYPCVLVEASPYDKVWGIGLEKHEQCAWNEATWDGKNLLGYILTEVRDELMCERGIISESHKKVYFEKLTKDLKENSFGRKYTHDRTTRQHYTVNIPPSNEDIPYSRTKVTEETASWTEQHSGGHTEGYDVVYQEKSQMEKHTETPLPGRQESSDTGELEQNEMDEEDSGNKRDDENAMKQIRKDEESTIDNAKEKEGIEMGLEEEKDVSQESHRKLSKDNGIEQNAFAFEINDETNLFVDMPPDHVGEKRHNNKINKNEQPRRLNKVETDVGYMFTYTEHQNPQERLYKPEYRSSREETENDSTTTQPFD